MRGDLADTTLPAICRSLAAERATGRLVLEGRDGRGTVTLLRGAISDASSPLPRARLRERLTGGGHVDELTMARIVHELRETAPGGAAGPPVDDGALAHALMERHLVDRELMERLLTAPVIDALVDLSARREGGFHFEVSDEAGDDAGGPGAMGDGHPHSDEDAPRGDPSGDGGARRGHPRSDEDAPRGDPSGDGAATDGAAGPRRLDVETTLREVVQRSDEVQSLPRVTRSPGTVPLLLLELPPTPGDLDADALTVLAAVDDQTDLGTIAARIGYGFFDVTCVVAALYARGIVALTEPSRRNLASAARTVDDAPAAAGDAIGRGRTGRVADHAADREQPTTRQKPDTEAVEEEKDRAARPTGGWTPSAPPHPPAASATGPSDQDADDAIPSATGAARPDTDHPIPSATGAARPDTDHPIPSTAGAARPDTDHPIPSTTGAARPDTDATQGRPDRAAPGVDRDAGDEPRTPGAPGVGADRAANAGAAARPPDEPGAGREATDDPASAGGPWAQPADEDSDADVSEFLRELSSLANRDDTRARRRRPPVQPEHAERSGAGNDGSAGSTHDAGSREKDEDPERAGEDRHQGPSAPQEDARRRRRGFFGRG